MLPPPPVSLSALLPFPPLADGANSADVTPHPVLAPPNAHAPRASRARRGRCCRRLVAFMPSFRQHLPDFPPSCRPHLPGFPPSCYHPLADFPPSQTPTPTRPRTHARRKKSETRIPVTVPLRTPEAGTLRLVELPAPRIVAAQRGRRRQRAGRVFPGGCCCGGAAA